jgi:hypothetical protein
MKKYFTHDGKEQNGPFNINELRELKIDKESAIWYEGLSEWTIAGNVDELKEIFTKTPPPFEKKITPPPIQKQSISFSEENSAKNKEKSSSSFATRLLLILIIGVVIIYFISQNNRHTSGSSGSDYFDEEPKRENTYQEKVMSVEEIEKSKPTKFLSADGNYNLNLLGDKIKVHGVIHNTATIAWFKDVVVKITYYSETETPLGSENYTIYDNFGPNSNTRFELKIKNYNNVSSIGWDVINAIPN